MKKTLESGNSEFGGAGTQFLIVLLVIVLMVNAGYQILPVLYVGESLKQEMHAAVLQGMALPGTAGKPTDVTKKRLQNLAVANQLPVDTVIDVRQNNNALSARIAYNKPISVLPFGLYTYNYQFDHTESPTGFLSK